MVMARLPDNWLNVLWILEKEPRRAGTMGRQKAGGWSKNAFEPFLLCRYQLHA